MGTARNRVGIQGGVEVIILDSKGQLQLRHRGRELNARFANHVPQQLKVGHELHLRVQCPIEGQAHAEVIDVLGSILLVEADDILKLQAGGRFQFGITRSLSDKLPLPVLGRDGVNALLDAWRRAMLPSKLATEQKSMGHRQTPPPIPQQRKRSASFSMLPSSARMSKAERLAVLERKVASTLDFKDVAEEQALPFASLLADHPAPRSLSNPEIDLTAFANLPVAPGSQVDMPQKSSNQYRA